MCVLLFIIIITGVHNFIKQNEKDGVIKWNTFGENFKKSL